MADKTLSRTDTLIEEILHEKKQRNVQKNPVASTTNLEDFVRLFYKSVSVEDLEGSSHSDLYSAAENVFSFFQQRGENTPKLRVYNPKLDEHGWESKHTVIEMINDDMPFLVDSVSEELSRQGLEIFRVIHPVLKVQRDAKGALQRFGDIDADSANTAKESVIHFEISPITDEAFLRKLTSEIETVLRTVRFAVTDWRAMITKADAVLEQTANAPAPASAQNDANVSKPEALEFLKWLKDNNFVFLGYMEYDFVKQGGKESLNVVKGSELGIFKDAAFNHQHPSLSAEALNFIQNDELLDITKSDEKSRVHRSVHMDLIALKRFDSKGNIIGEARFIGLFTSIVYFQSAKQIPIIRQKIDYVVRRAAFSPSGHSNKALLAVLDGFPRDELFQMSAEELFETSMGIVTLATRPRVRLFVRKDSFERFMSCIIFVPRERFSTQLRTKIQDILCAAFAGSVANHYTQITDSHLARLHVIIKAEPGKIPAYDVNDLEKQLTKTVNSWSDELRTSLIELNGEAAGEGLNQKYARAFSISYTNRFTTDIAAIDIQLIEALSPETTTNFNLYEENGALQLKIYSAGTQLSLSDVMPILENMGVKTLDSNTFQVTPTGEEKTIWLHHFRFMPQDASVRHALPEIKNNFEVALARIWQGEIQNDGFNTLILRAAFSWREVVLIRAYSKYLRQAAFTYSQEYIEEALAKNPSIARLLVDLFITRFDPAYKGNRDSDANAITAKISELLGGITNIAEDRVIRRLLDVNVATLRTNFYQTTPEGAPKPYISFKLNSQIIPELPLPRPHVEIFVYSSRVEAIHLRGGKVARGGLRWSDRAEDFRTEVLGLMKAQMTKNAVIVPVGSKGGFIVKRPPTEGGREAFMNEGIECYKTFLRGVLDITDNVIGGKVITPPNVIRQDSDDPYLVVAADKGTATFSDIANGVAKEYNFWLGDAFASGGSAGYDHKGMGITARGGWVSVKRHFAEMGHDTQSQDFTTIGIGDMAGDVFGNGMLLSKHIKLVGAFNHMHIFLDPAPNAARSFDERQRLFTLPRSTWKDYDASLISQGGGIYERSAKSITISAEAKQLLALDTDTLTPDELIKAMLLAPIDLLWNGGIGTYVKASDESHEDVGDKTNNAVRVNGKQLRCKVVGEGGNLGFTQRGRIEFAMRGGRINTDAIDNSAGVDCSDHEVNIKIGLSKALENGSLKAEDRDAFLSKMTESVGQLVLRDNQLQTQAISIAEQQGTESLEPLQRLIHQLEAEGLLNRKIEFLPEDEVISRLAAEKKGLTRPELAVLLAYSKMSIYNNLLASNLPDDAYYVDELVEYFPEEMQKDHRAAIEAHQLRREIIATCITNNMVNRMGSTFFHHVCEDTGMRGCDVARAYTISRDIYDIPTLWDEIESLDGKIPAETQAEMFYEIQSLIERSTLWFLRNHPQPLELTTATAKFAQGIRELSSNLKEVLTTIAMESLQKRSQYLIDAGVPQSLAERIAGLATLASATDIVQVAQVGKLPVNVVGKIYFRLGTRLNIGWLRAQVQKANATSYWDRLSQKTLIDDLYDQQRRLAAEVIKLNCDGTQCDVAMENWLQVNEKEVVRYDAFVKDMKARDNISFPMLVVGVKRVESICPHHE